MDSKIIKTVAIMGLIAVMLGFCGCAKKNETTKLGGNRFVVLNLGEPTEYKTRKGKHEALFVFTAPETGVYTVWNESSEYAFCRMYNAPTLDWSIYSDCEIEPFVKSFPLNAGESAYIGSINFSSDKGYKGVITVDLREKGPVPYENYGFPIQINVGDVVPFNFKYNYTPIVYEFIVPQDGTYLFYTDGDENALPYLNVYSDPWCHKNSFIENIDHHEIPTESYYIIEDSSFSEAMDLKAGDVIYLALAVRTADSQGNFYIRLL